MIPYYSAWSYRHSVLLEPYDPEAGLAVVKLSNRIIELSGVGQFSGGFPEWIVTADGVPAKATVRVILRHPGNPLLDGVVVAETESGQDGTWLVAGLHTGFKYDVIGRKAGFNDVIMADVTPEVE